MAEFALFNRLGLAVTRLDFVGGVHTVEPPAEVQPNTTLTWQSEDTGSVTYQASSGNGERGAVRRFTLEWAFDASGAPTCRARDVGRGLKVTIERQGDGVRFVVARRRARRVPPPAPRLGGALSRLAPLPAAVGAVLVAALLAGSVTAVANPFHWTLPLPTPSARGHVVPAQVVADAPLDSSVDCAAPALSFGAITLRNAGGQTLAWHASATAAGASVSPPSGSLGAGQSQTLHVTQSGPTSTATGVHITSNGGDVTLAYSCKAQPAPKLAVSPAQGSTLTCSGSSVPYPAITVRNAGGQTLTWQASTSTFKAAVSPPSGSLGAGQSQTLHVAQSGPAGTAAGVHIASNGGSATLTFSCAASSQSSSSGTTTTTLAPQLAVSPTQATVTCSGSSVAYPAITVRNAGGQTLTWRAEAQVVAGAAVSPPSGSLGAGQSQALQVTQPGPTTTAANVEIFSNVGNVVVQFNCAPVAPPPVPHGNLVVNPNPLALGTANGYCGGPIPGEGPPVTITLTNTGNGPLTWSQSGGSGFTLVPSSGQLNAGASQLVTVSGTLSNASFGIAWQDAGGGNTNTMTVSTSCIVAPHLTVNPTQVTLGGACPSSATVTLGNSGGQTLNWSAAFGGTWGNGATASPASGSIAPGQSVPVTISGTPVNTSNPVGTVTINSDGGTIDISVSWGCPF